jgi:AraC-like DNA-binding protein
MNAEPTYFERPPRRSLARFVHCVWSFTAPADETPQPIAPDGRPELIVHCRAPYRELTNAGYVAQPPVLFAGQLTTPLTLKAQGEIAVIGVRLHPAAARAFLGFDASATTDQRVDLTTIHGDRAARLHRDARVQPDWERSIDMVEDYAEAALRNAEFDTGIAVAVDAIFAGAETVPISHVSERQWQRNFKHEVGISPRMLQTIARFRRVFDAIEHPETSSWLEAALKAGYFDQPQMARDFRRFLGCTARDWVAQKAGLATALAGV